MKLQHVQGVGNFKEDSGYWVAEPEQLKGADINIGSPEITPEQGGRARSICESWENILANCAQFIESNRTKYDLKAMEFSDPGAFIDSGDCWTVYFDTESEIEAVVGVEFKGDNPFQLIIGD